MEYKNKSAPPILMGMLSTTISWLVNEDELNQSVTEYLDEIHELSDLSDNQLRDIGISRDQITAFVLHENAEN